MELKMMNKRQNIDLPIGANSKIVTYE